VELLESYSSFLHLNSEVRRTNEKASNSSENEIHLKFFSASQTSNFLQRQIKMFEWKIDNFTFRVRNSEKEKRHCHDFRDTPDEDVGFDGDEFYIDRRSNNSTPFPTLSFSFNCFVMTHLIVKFRHKKWSPFLSLLPDSIIFCFLKLLFKMKHKPTELL
jgi:hypothetical protein